MLMALGMFAFELGSLPYAELERRTDWRFGESPRFGARPASQFLGPGGDTIRLSGMIAPGVAGSFSSLRTLRELAGQGESWPLVDGTGRVFGNYRIDAVDDRQTAFLDNGVPRMSDFSIDITRVS